MHKVFTVNSLTGSNWEHMLFHFRKSRRGSEVTRVWRLDQRWCSQWMKGVCVHFLLCDLEYWCAVTYITDSDESVHQHPPLLQDISIILCSYQFKWQSHIRVNFEEKSETSIIVPHILLLHLQSGTSFKSNYVKAISVETAHFTNWEPCSLTSEFIISKIMVFPFEWSKAHWMQWIYFPNFEFTESVVLDKIAKMLKKKFNPHARHLNSSLLCLCYLVNSDNLWILMYRVIHLIISLKKNISNISRKYCIWF